MLLLFTLVETGNGAFFGLNIDAQAQETTPVNIPVTATTPAPAKKTTTKKRTTKKTTTKTTTAKKATATKSKKGAITPKKEEKSKTDPKSDISNDTKTIPAAAIKPKSQQPENAAAKVLLSPKVSVDKTIIAKDEEQSTNTITRVITIARGETITRALTRSGIVQGEALALTKVVDKSGFVSVPSLTNGQKLSLTQSLKSGTKTFISLEIPLDKNTIQIFKTGDRKYKVRRTPNSLLKKEAPKEIPKDTNIVKKTFKSGPINSSLVELSKSINIPREVLADAVKILSGKHNLANTIQKRDRFSVLYEEVFDKNNKKIGTHKILFTSIKGVKNNLKAYRFSPNGKDSAANYYDETGAPYRSSITNRPLKSRAKITSGFGYRIHPILKRRILHTGTDFSAKTGTPIYAAGEGVILMAGRYGGYGNYVKIRHDAVYETAYGHMSKIAPGMKKFKKVNKGDLIGYVGSTGRSTGAHLHFELIKRGIQINSEKEILPSGKKLSGKEFRDTVNDINAAVTRLTDKAKKR